MRTFKIFLFALSMSGCQFDPHASLYTTTEPQNADIIGTYVLDHYDLPNDIPIESDEVVVVLNADGTFDASNVPTRETEADKSFFSSLKSDTGKWEKAAMGVVGSKSIWGVYLRTNDNRILSADFTGTQPPYGMIFVLGDPDAGNAVILKKTK